MIDYSFEPRTDYRICRTDQNGKRRYLTHYRNYVSCKTKVDAEIFCFAKNLLEDGFLYDFLEPGQELLTIWSEESPKYEN